MLLSRVSRKLKRKSQKKDLRDVTNETSSSNNIRDKETVATKDTAAPTVEDSSCFKASSPEKSVSSPVKVSSTSLHQARDELERVLKEAHILVEHAKSEESVAASELERISQEEQQARDIYQHADPSMERFVRSSLKQYWRLGQKRKKAAFRTLQASRLAVEEAQDVFEWTLKGALENVQRAKLYHNNNNEENYEEPYEDGSTIDTEEESGSATPSPTYMGNFGEDRPSRLFGMFDAKEYLEKMEIEASEVESEDEMPAVDPYY